MTTSTLRDRWRAGESTFGGWLSLPSTVLAEAAARIGFDYVCVDTQHGAIDYADTIGLVQAILLGGSSPIVRVPWNEPGIIGKSLDAGAHGVIIPMVNTVDDARAAVRACRYAPEGARSWGPSVAGLRADYRQWASDHVACIPMIETAEALGNLDEILGVAGIDAVYVGPADLSISLGLPPGNNDGEALFDDALARIVEACGTHDIIAGIHSSGALASRRVAAGFEMVTVGADLVAARAGLRAELAAARQEDKPGGTAAPY